MNNYLITHPWYWCYAAAKQRCKPTGKYGRRGITFHLTCEQVGEIWKRDKADLLKQPSIDRIDTTKGYTFDNVQFIELRDNMLKPKHYPPGWRNYSKQRKPALNIREVKYECEICHQIQTVIRTGYGGRLNKTCRPCQKHAQYLKHGNYTK